jgi:hypothetical protein
MSIMRSYFHFREVLFLLFTIRNPYPYEDLVYSSICYRNLHCKKMSNEDSFGISLIQLAKIPYIVDEMRTDSDYHLVF